MINDDNLQIIDVSQSDKSISETQRVFLQPSPAPSHEPSPSEVGSKLSKRRKFKKKKKVKKKRLTTKLNNSNDLKLDDLDLDIDSLEETDKSPMKRIRIEKLDSIANNIQYVNL